MSKTTIDDPQGRPIVIVAVDNSSQAENAFNWYINEAHQKRHKVLIAHCIQQAVVMGGSTGALYGGMLREANKEAQEVKAKYGELCQRHQVGGEYLSAIHSRPAEWLIETCAQHNATLLVTGCRGQNALRRTVLGSVSNYVLHHAHCPVAIVHFDPKQQNK